MTAAGGIKCTVRRGREEILCAAAGVVAFQLVDLPGIQACRDAHLEQVRDRCAYGIAQIRGFLGEPAALRECTPAASCARFVDALEGRTDLATAWRDVVRASCTPNVDTKICEAP